jgi:hypothetical protein
MTRARGVGLLAVILCAFAPGAVTAGTAADDDLLADCAARALPRGGTRQRQHVRIESAQGWTREAVRRVWFRPGAAGDARLLIALEAPRQEAGLKVLAIVQAAARPEIWVWSPDTRRARRMVGAGASASLLGSDFTAQDAAALAGMLDAPDTRRLEDARVDGRETFVVETPVTAAEAGYSQVRAWIDRAWCVPLRAEFRDTAGSAVKTLTAPAAAVRTIGAHHVPMTTVVADHRSGSTTTIELDEVEFDLDLPDALFNPQSLDQAP